MKKKILLTGGSGFIGKNILEKLANKYLFLAPTHSQLNLSDINEVSSYIKINRPEILIHAANVGGNLNEANFSNVAAYNLRIFFNLIKNARNFQKIIYFGSGSDYGKQQPISRVREKDFDKRIPLDDFGLYKYICTKYIENSSENIINLRIFGIFGEYEDYRFRFISNVICQALFNMPIIIKQNAIFEYVYIDDFIKIVDYFISHDAKYKTYNIGRNDPLKLLDIAKKILSIEQKNLRLKVQKEAFNKEYTCDASRLIRELEGFKFEDFDYSLNSLYEWYKNRQKSIDPNSLVNFLK